MNIAILGMGKIGSGVYELISNRNDMRVKRVLDIRAWADYMTTDINDILINDSISTVVETMGGLHPAYEYAVKCISAGKNFVSANKHMLSVYGLELQRLANEKNASLMFSAACGGGIPYLTNIMNFRKADGVKSVGGILNGTTNYMLDLMQRSDLDYDSALSEAQALGYAEKDPSGDVDGFDAQRKLTLACLTAFGKSPRASDIPTRGIRGISKTDIEYFKKRGVTARLIAEAELTETGVSAVVETRLFGNDSMESHIRENLNYAWYCGAMSGKFAFTGQGAGKYPTACNVVADLLAIQNGEKGMLPNNAEFSERARGSARTYYVRVRKSECTALQKLLTKELESGYYIIGETIPMTADEINAIMKDADGFCAAYE